MSRFRMWTAGVLSRVDWMVSQVENHEALAQSAIRDVQQAAARARVQLGRVRRDGERLRERHAQAHEAVDAWRERARDCARQAGARDCEPVDEERALECLRRSKRAACRAAELGRRVAEHERAEKQLALDVSRIDERLAELKERRNLLRTRQSRAEALAEVREVDGPACGDVGELFDRWETRVTEREFESECAAPDGAGLGEPPGGGDAFAVEFAEREEEAALRDELQSLVASEKEKAHA